jgi:hypothetical protein
MVGMYDDSVVGQSRRDAVQPAKPVAGRCPAVRECSVERIETVVMTAVQYERVVTGLATLIVKWVTAPGQHHGMTAGHLCSD